MTRTRLVKLLGGMALLGPLSAPAWAGDKAGQSAVQIYNTEDVITQATRAEQDAPEPPKPMPTEHNGAAMVGGCSSCCSEPGLLQEWMSSTRLGSWLDCNRVKVSGHVDQGVTLNGDRPHDHLNFGRIFDDRANDYRFNQALVTFERALCPEACGSDWGFKAQFMYGSDARNIHSLGFMDNITNETVQLDIVEMYWSYHTPMLTEGGVDLKAGQFISAFGVERINAMDNLLYSHSYVFNFIDPFKYTGVMATAHVTSQLDLSAGAVVGINAGSFDDNNDAWSFVGGMAWHSCDGCMSLGANLHIGPEEDSVFSRIFGFDTNDNLGYILDIVGTYQWSDRVTLMSQLNWTKEEGFHAEAYGWTQYFVYKINNCMAGIVRFEIFRDDDGLFVNQYAQNDDYINLERGELGALDPRTHSGGDSTYTALTLGLNIKPYEHLLIRPEIRMDWASGGNAPFDDSSDNKQFTAGLDVIWSF